MKIDNINENFPNCLDLCGALLLLEIVNMHQQSTPIKILLINVFFNPFNFVKMRKCIFFKFRNNAADEC